jgi:hypothetical protein
MTTYGQIRFLLSKEIPGVDTEKLDGYINDRYTAILNKIDWTRARVNATLATVAGQSVYALAAGAETMNDAAVSDPPIPLERVSRGDLSRIDPNREASGPPRVWAPSEDDNSTPSKAQVELYPVPDAVYSIPYWYTPDATLFGPFDTASILPAWIDPGCLKAGVKADMFVAAQPALAAIFEAKYRELLTSTINKESRQAGNKKIRMADRFVRHRLERAMKGSRTVPFVLP